jgi:hypothetical protein
MCWRIKPYRLGQNWLANQAIVQLNFGCILAISFLIELKRAQVIQQWRTNFLAHACITAGRSGCAILRVAHLQFAPFNGTGATNHETLARIPE